MAEYPTHRLINDPTGYTRYICYNYLQLQVNSFFCRAEPDNPVILHPVAGKSGTVVYGATLLA